MRILHALWSGFGLLALAACQGNQDSSLSKQDIDAIRATQDKYVNAALAADWDALGTTLTSDAVFMPPDMAPLKDRDAYVAWLRNFHPKISAFTLPENEIVGAGSIAYGRGTYTQTIASTSEVAEGVRTETFRKQPDGSWLYSGGIFHPKAAAGGSPAANRSNDEAAIRALVKEVEVLVNKRDFTTYANLYVEDGDVVIPDTERASGRDAVRTTFEAAWKGQPAACRITIFNDSIRFLAADMALTEDHATLTGCKNLTPGRDTAVVVRRDGKWQLAALRIYQPVKGN